MCILESDTYLHAWEQMAIIMADTSLHGIVCDIGMPIMHRNNRFNCRVIILDGRILFIRAKLFLANDGNYRENRHFIPWGRPQHVEDYYLPQMIQNLQGTKKVPIGDMVLSTPDTCLGFETCEELFTPQSPHIDMSLNGVEVITNSSGSHHSLRKLQTRLSLITEATRKCGGVYLYSNLQGGDGDRLLYDGGSMIVVNGEVVAQGSQFSLNDVEVVTATIDIEEVRAYRSCISRGHQSINAPTYERHETDFSLGLPDAELDLSISPTPRVEIRIHRPEEEIMLSASCWLWDYLRRSGAAGFLIPLSGGLDSCSTATLVFSMSVQICKALEQGNEQVKADVQRIAGVYEAEGWLPKSPQELTSRLLETVFMGMKEQSSTETRTRAADLSTAIGSKHTDMNIDAMFHAFRDTFAASTSFTPNFRSAGGTPAENLALQNIQARSRMVTAYLYAQLLPTVRQRPGGGGLLVLGSGNVDECLRGYLTKYDCSSADINPIGGISKTDLKAFLTWASTSLSLPILTSFVEATPTAELEPITAEYTQSDEADMGMTYHELSIFGRLRKERKLGPFGMWQALVFQWKDEFSPKEVADKVKRFYHYWAINRHKMTVMTPSLHMEDYSPDDNRFDLRPFCYFPFYRSWSFKKIDEGVERLERVAAGK
ncbi:glutamine-dependent NAD(+) synthetase [Parastagonospora nodorum]|nr:glutamine-dependent NAD(+) synthetase [Parastagonospora nodorum]KAH4680400.1 glutamine-dependent NAD(+) synthetase [Parastagonospora nodorum]KAH4712015.1 glutamine-dependent NAD(+) synthetase [Parastagonospora nodorum]KAH4763541.1 glutamine-dependent NAD(+) synthetase [Parastagonospora nodorum]KAH4787595.1 glutamine-dependent NAD(+) synthetase [Parastagonospora nodorum]